MTNNEFVSIKVATDFLRKCLAYLSKASKSLEVFGRIELANDSDSWKRAKILNYLDQSIHFFYQRIEFFLICLNNEEVNRDILETLFRGLIEIYCRMLFLLKSSDDDAIKRIIWQDLYLIGLTDVDVRKVKAAGVTVEINNTILKSLGLETLDTNEVSKMIKSWLMGDKKDKYLCNLQDKYGFPGVRKILNQFYNEKEDPSIPKYWIYRRYCELSEQIHGNFLLEYYGPNQKSDYRVIAFLVILSLKFLKLVSERTRSEEEFVKLVAEAKTFAPDYLKLWSPHRYS